MTEQEWLASEDPEAMLRLLGGERGPTWEPSGSVRPSDRKLRLWCCAVRMAITSQCHDYDRPEEAYAGVDDGRATWSVEEKVDSCLYWQSLPPHVYPKGIRPRLIGLAEKANLLRDVVGNPWRPVEALWPGCYECHGRGRWAQGYQPDFECPECDGTGKRRGELITPTVLSVAQAAYDERRDDGTLDPVRLAVLADALEEASCNNREILDHLRNNAIHVRGCWVLDLVLGKE